MQTDPKTFIIFVLLCKFFSFVALSAKRADNAHACQIFLRNCGENTLVFVADLKPLSDLPVKQGGIADDERHKRNRNKRELDIHRKHKIKGEHQHNDYPENGGQLVGEEALDVIDI